MVETLDIKALLESTYSITEKDKTVLSALVVEKPWSEPIQQAWLKALYQSKDSRFKIELERVAFVSSDRPALYELIYGAALQKTIDKVELELEELETNTLSPEWEKTTDSSNSSAAENKEDVKEIEANVPEITIAKLPELEEQIKLQAADAIISKDILEDIKEKKLVKETAVEDSNESNQHVSSSDFLNWLTKKAADIEYPAFERLEYSKPSSGVSSKDLVENFIKNDPKITPGKSREYGLEDLAKESLVDNEEFVTETLAEIYASQGNISKAKRAFQLLSLKYPEKSIYFAARIKQLGKKK